MFSRYCVFALTVLFVQQAVGQRAPRLLDSDWRTDWGKRTIELTELEANVPRDAIPSIDNPRFVSIALASDWIGENEPVLVVSLGREARAYPLQVLIWHELVNDKIAGVPVAVTFCPLCYSAMVFDRRVDDDEYQLGVSGMLRFSDLVMYDRQTHSLWQQLSGEAIVGALAGKELSQLPAQIISFEQFRTAHPFGHVLSRDTGYERRYGENPYPGYDDISDKPWAFRGEIDDRLPAMEKVIGVQIGETYVAYPHSTSRKDRVIQEQLGEKHILVFHSRSGATSSLDKSSIKRSRVIGTTGVFDPQLDDGSVLRFSPRGDTFVDQQTGSEWDVTGRAISGSLSGTQLEPIIHTNMFAFAWLVVHPDSRIYTN